MNLYLVAALLFGMILYSAIPSSSDSFSQSTSERLSHLRASFEMYAIEHGVFPDSFAVREALPKENSKPFRDEWNHPILIQFDKPRTKVTLRSIGANALDEQGRGDDLSVEISLEEILREQEMLRKVLNLKS